MRRHYRTIDNETPESLYLDYKACAALGKTDAKRTELTRDVSAFANAGRGTLVYGVLEANSAAVGFDVGFDPTDISRDWIEQVVASGILANVAVYAVNLYLFPVVFRFSLGQFAGVLALVLAIALYMWDRDRRRRAGVARLATQDLTRRERS